jgi:hypothetical protein
MSLEYRELKPEEFEKAPREVEHSERFTPANSRILAAFNEDGEVVATWTMFAACHIEPVWIREDHRGGTGILRGLARHMKVLLRASGLTEAYTVAMDATPVLQRFACWFGAEPVCGTLFLWRDPQVNKEP